MALSVELDGIFTDDVIDAAIYTPDGGDAVSVDVLVLDERTEENIDNDRSGELWRLRCVVKESEITEPMRGDTITVLGRTYTIESKEIQAGTWQIEAERFVAQERNSNSRVRQR